MLITNEWGAHTKQCLYYYTFGCVPSFTWLTWLLQIYFDSLFELCFAVPWCWGMGVRTNISWVLMSLLNQKISPIKQALLKFIFFFSLLRAKSLHIIIVDWGNSIANFAGPLITCLLLILEELWNGQFLFGAISQLSTEIDDVCGFLEIWEQLKTIFLTTKLAPSQRYFGEIAIWFVLSCSLKIGMKCSYLGMLSSWWGNHLKGFWFKLLVDNPTTGLDNKQTAVVHFSGCLPALVWKPTIERSWIEEWGEGESTFRGQNCKIHILKSRNRL